MWTVVEETIKCLGISVVASKTTEITERGLRNAMNPSVQPRIRTVEALIKAVSGLLEEGAGMSVEDSLVAMAAFVSRRAQRPG